jgi:hypothetical protein
MRYSGIGYVFTEDDPYTGIDLDKCCDSNGNIDQWAQDIIDALNSYTEISPSGTGIHIIVKGTLPQGRNRNGHIEAYSNGRYFTMTGNRVPGTPSTIEERQQELNTFCTRYLSQKEVPTGGVCVPDNLTRWCADHQLITHAMQAKDREKFCRLFVLGDWESLYPSQSEADVELCKMLAYWTGNNVDWIEHLFRLSPLSRRDKWERQDYRQSTIAEAIKKTHTVYVPPKQPFTIQTQTASEIMNKTIEPTNWVIPGILCEGLTILAGKPKAGKSYMVLHWSLAIATGSPVFNTKIKAPQAEVLYGAFEDNDARMQIRMDELGADPDTVSKCLHITYKMPQLHQGLTTALENLLTMLPHIKLVILDTLAKIRPPHPKGADLYAADYAQVSELQHFAHEHRIALVVVHHTNKRVADDVLEMVSGTNGLTGAADTIMVYTRPRGAPINTSELFITGRDVDEQRLTIEFDKDQHRWTVLPGSAQMSLLQRQILLTLPTAQTGMTPKEVAIMLKNKNENTVRGVLRKLYRDGYVSVESSRYARVCGLDALS